MGARGGAVADRQGKEPQKTSSSFQFGDEFPHGPWKSSQRVSGPSHQRPSTFGPGLRHTRSSLGPGAGNCARLRGASAPEGRLARSWHCV